MTRFYFSAVVMMACGGTTTDTTDASDTSTPPISTDLTDVNCALNANVPTESNFDVSNVSLIIAGVEKLLQVQKG